ncbi:MAG: hypothetical protein WCG55_02105 [bacterium]
MQITDTINPANEDTQVDLEPFTDGQVRIAEHRPCADFVFVPTEPKTRKALLDEHKNNPLVREYATCAPRIALYKEALEYPSPHEGANPPEINLTERENELFLFLVGIGYFSAE